jgi:plasmid stabilization system protein ParE
MGEGHWLIPSISLSMEAQQELDRRRAVRMPLQELQALTDELIVSWYEHQSVLDQALARIRQLEVQLALAGAPPSSTTPSPEHFAMAREIMRGREA